MTGQMKSSPAVRIVTCLMAVSIGVMSLATPLQAQTQPSAGTGRAATAPRQLERVHFGEAAFTMPASRPAWPVVPSAGDTYAAKIHAIIQNTPRGHADVLGALATVVAANPDRRAVSLAAARGELGSMNTGDLPRLADALLEGDVDDQLLARVRAQIHVDNNIAFPPDWKYGSVVFRLAMQKVLWAKAVNMKDTDPAAAARFARACVLFAAYDDFSDHGVGLRWVMEQANPSFAAVAQLSETQMQTLSKMANANESMIRSVGIMQNTLTDSLDAWLDAKPPALSAIQRERFVTLLQKWWIIGDAPRVPATAWQVANASWRVMSLAQSFKDQETIDALTKLVRGFETELTNADEMLWLEEAITTTGPTPQHSRPFILTPSAGR